MIRAFEASFITKAVETKRERMKRFFRSIMGNQPVTDKGVWVIHFLYDTESPGAICPVSYGQNIAREYNEILMRRGRQIIIYSMKYKEIRVNDIDKKRMFFASKEQRDLLRKVEKLMRGEKKNEV